MASEAKHHGKPTGRDRAGSMTIDDTPIYHLQPGVVAGYLKTNMRNGLKSDEIADRRTFYGSNIIAPPKKKSYIIMALQHLFNSITFILYAVFIICAVNYEWIDAGVVMFIILANAALGFIQELKSEQSLAALQEQSKDSCMVIRDGSTLSISIDDVVVGDIVELKQGDTVPADIRLFEAINLETLEALLTGESTTVYKNPEPIPMPAPDPTGKRLAIALGDRNNMVFRQTEVRAGTGKGIVVAVGYDTKVGQLASKLMAPQDETTPLQRKMSVFMYVLFAVAVVLAFVIFGITGWKFDKETAVYASATGIALLPEALIAVVTVTLALATRRMSEKRAVIKKMTAVEVLGNVTDICSDKTGTLTEGKMVVKRVWPGGDHPIYHVTGGVMDATAGFGIEADDVAPLSPNAMRRSLSGNNSVNLGLNAPVGSAASSAAYVLPDGRVESSKGISQSQSRRIRAPTYDHAVPRVVQGEKSADYTVVQTACEDLALVCGMCNNTQLQLDEEDDKLVGVGNPTEIALQVFSFKIGRSPFYWADKGYIKCGQWAFDSKVKCMSQGVVYYADKLDSIDEKENEDEEKDHEGETNGTTSSASSTNDKTGEDGRTSAKNISKHSEKGGCPPSKTRKSLILTKGAPEAVLPKCIGANTENIMAHVSHLANQGYRVLACAIGTHLDLDDVDGLRLHDYERSKVECNLRFVGLVVVFDPPRAESYDAVRLCKQAGITFRMVTGDHHATAESIARRLKILESYDGSDRVITGPTLDAMTEEQIDAMPELPLVIARCSPDSKVKMVEALHRRKKIVAMTGDGVNDAPAIKIADVGACMGIAGASATKGVADLIMTDDNIATLVSAVEEGRHVASSIRKFVTHLVTSNIAEVIILMVGLAFEDNHGEVVFPMTPLQILWLNMLTSTPPAIGMSLDPADPEQMHNPPDDRPLFSQELILDNAVLGLIMGGLTFAAYCLVIFAFGDGDFGYNCNSTEGRHTCTLPWRARTTAFLTLNQLLLAHAYVCRDPRNSMFSKPIFNNFFLVVSTILGTAFALFTVYIPALAQTLFKQGEITWEWAIVWIAVVIYLILSEIWKFIKRRIYKPIHEQRSRFTTEDGGQLELVTMG